MPDRRSIIDESEQTLARDLFHFAFDACPSGMIMTDADGIVVMVNTEVEQLFGYSRDELVSQPIEQLIPRRREHKVNGNGSGNGSGDWKDDATPLSTSEQRGLLGRRADGSDFAIEVRSNSINIATGTLILNSVIDISGRRRFEQLKDEFVSNVSHELRTPLTSIAGSLALIANGAAGRLPERALRLITIAHKNSERLIRLINDLLDAEKMESGKLQLDFKPRDAVELIEQALEANRGFASQYCVGFKVSAPREPVLIRADGDRFLQVVTNLLSNAIKYSPSGSDVEISVVRRESMVRIDVRDHGPGIPEEFKPRLFERFAQAEERQKGGTGLGLSIVKQLVVLHGGSIWVESPSDGGTSFCMELAFWDDAENDQTGAARRGLLDQVEPDQAVQQDNREVA